MNGSETDFGVRYLLDRVGLIEDRVRVLVAHRRQDDPAPDDPFRGLYLTEEAIARILNPAPAAPVSDRGRLGLIESGADAAESAGAQIRLRDLTRRIGLTELELEILLIALVPDLDSRFERLYGYLNDDVTRRRATIGLTLALTHSSPSSAWARSRLAPGCALVDQGLVLIEDPDRPFLTRSLRVPDRLTAHLLGDDTMDNSLAGLVVQCQADDPANAGDLARAILAGNDLVYVRESITGTGSAMGVAALKLAGLQALCVDLGRLAAQPDAAQIIRTMGREALLTKSGLVAAMMEPLVESHPAAVRLLTEMTIPVILIGNGTWDPQWAMQIPLITEARTPTPAERTTWWNRELGHHSSETSGDAAVTTDTASHPDAGGGIDVRAVTAHFVLGPQQISRAVAAARAATSLTGGELTADGLRRGARAQNAAGLERLARRIEPQVGWADVVLPPASLRQLHELAARARHRDQVLNEWNMRPGGGRGNSVTALFAGDSGTGKTMSAEVIAGELGLDLYTVNLATVVDKYVGETEKNLERIFAEAGGVNAVILFDEADAIFGKRSEVRDAHDRYANIESAYLLQRMETFSGLAILSTNLRSNIDEAFTRRLDTIIDFPSPDENARLALWRRCLAAPLPCADDLDLEFCARAFELSGGNIRSVGITAAYLAAGSGGKITMIELISAVQQEYRKLGRLILEREFGPHLIRSTLS